MSPVGGGLFGVANKTPPFVWVKATAGIGRVA